MFKTFGANSKVMRGLINNQARNFSKYVLAIDQGTTSSRVLVVDKDLKIVDVATRGHT